MKTKDRLKILILRSQKAYLYYNENGKAYFLAKRIYAANQLIYATLNDYVLEMDNLVIENFDYIFHLEDWFLQFEEAEKAIKHPTDVFVFERWKGGIPYPKTLIEKLLD